LCEKYGELLAAYGERLDPNIELTNKKPWMNRASDD